VMKPSGRRASLNTARRGEGEIRARSSKSREVIFKGMSSSLHQGVENARAETVENGKRLSSSKDRRIKMNINPTYG
jgi:hypothetical protein